MEYDAIFCKCFNFRYDPDLEVDNVPDLFQKAVSNDKKEAFIH